MFKLPSVNIKFSTTVRHFIYQLLSFFCCLLLLCGCSDEEQSPAPPPGAEQPQTIEPAVAAVPATPLSPEQRYNGGADAPAEPHAAIAWYTEFAQAGIADASYKLGMCYYNTRAIPRNFIKAVEHLHTAAQQGHPEACAKLAECYEQGIGVEANPAEAAKWKNK